MFPNRTRLGPKGRIRRQADFGNTHCLTEDCSQYAIRNPKRYGAACEGIMSDENDRFLTEF